MRAKKVSVLALAVAACFPARAIAWQLENVDPPSKELPALGSGILSGVSPLALIAAGLGVALGLAAGGGGGGGGDAGSGSAGLGGDASPPSDPTGRKLTYTSSADFQTSEYSAQYGLHMVKAAKLYYNGHYQWYAGQAPHSAAGSGIGVKVAVADTGINASESSTGAAIAIDAARSYDYVKNQSGSAADDFGHGTHVAGIIAAPKNSAGMHGLAFNASVVNFKIGDAAGFITASDAQLGDMFTRAGNAGAMIINNSWASPAAITSYTAADLQASMPLMIEGARAYVAKGGVVVFAAGNESSNQPAVQAGLPYRIGGLQPGWLAVVAVDPSGQLASYSNRCGVAAAWCLAAPGGGQDSGVYSMYSNGGYAAMYGTSMAAPHASAAIAGLKSMFPNLSYLQIRDRLLFSANRSGAYADPSVYGQGLMDLEAASSPIGGTAVPTGTSANGATAAVTGSGIEFQAGMLRALGMQSWVLVVDNYQRAPFWMPAQTFFREAAPRMLERQWTSLRSAARSPLVAAGSPWSFSYSPGLNNVVSAELASYRLGFAKGTGGEAILGSHLELAWLPRLAAPGTDSIALGYASDLGGVRLGLLGTVPSAQPTNDRTLEASSFGSRRALGVVAQQRLAGTTYGVTMAFADHFERPIGIATSGAFGIDNSAALSSGMFVQQSVGASTVLEASLELARHRAEASAALTAPAYAVRSAGFGARTLLGPKTTLSAGLKHEWTGGEAARLHVPLTIDENGDIGRVTYALPYDELVGRTSFSLRLDHQLARQVELRAGVTHERYGFGASATGIAAVLEITN
jgi:subtilisin family serine protease